MRAQRVSAFFVAAIALVVVLAMPLHAIASPAWATTKITSGTADNYYPQVSGDRLVWVAGTRAYTWAAGDDLPTSIPGRDVGQQQPQVSGDRVVFYGYLGSTGRIATWKPGDSEPTTLTVNSDFRDWCVSGSRVVYTDTIASGVFTWEYPEASPSPVSDGVFNVYSSQVSGDRIVWVGYDGANGNNLYTRIVGSPTVQITFGTRIKAYPHVSGDRVVWAGEGPDARYYVYTWTPQASEPVTLGPTLDPTGESLNSPQPLVSDDRVVWLNSDGVNNQVCTWRAGGVVTTLTADAHDHSLPDVSGDRVVWLEPDSDGVNQVMEWKAGDSVNTSLTAGPNNHDRPHVSGDRVAYTGMDAGHWQVFTSKFGVPHTVSYVAGTGGSIEGSATQVVGDSSNATTVTAVASDGYRFVEWSDHNTNPSRRERNVTADGAFYATFVSTAVVVPPDAATALARPSISPSSPRKGKKLAFSCGLSPGVAALAGAKTLYLYHSETKTVTKIVKGKKRKVKVVYWRLRNTLKMTGVASGKLTTTGKLSYRGKWRMYAAYSGSPGYKPCSSTYKTFTVK